MRTIIFAIFLLLLSNSLRADWFKQDVQPEVAGRDAANGCLFDGPVYLKIRADSGQTVFWVFTDPNGITFPMTFTVDFSESFKGLVPATLPPGYDSVPNGSHWLIHVALWDASGTYYKSPDPIMSFNCPRL